MSHTSVSKRKLAVSRQIVRVVRETLVIVHLQPDAIQKAVLIGVNEMDILFVVLDTRKLAGALSAYTSPALMHQLTTALKGKPVAISNSTGLRYAVLLSAPPELPKRTDLPEVQYDQLRIGLRANRKPLSVTWDGLGHVLVAGMTRSGKSTFLRSLVYQAIAGDAKLLLGDLHQTAFPMLAGHGALLSPLTNAPEGYLSLVQQALDIVEQRQSVFADCPAYPEKLSEYNAWAVRNGKEPLARVIIVLDEYPTAAKVLGTRLGDALSRLAYQGLKFGVHLVLAAQAFDKKTLGDVRDQFGTVVAFKVKNTTVARNVGVAKAERIPASRPGLAITDRWGLVQTYYLPKDTLIALGAGERPDLLSEAERNLVVRALQVDGKLSRPLMEKWGWGQRAARRLLTNWELRGWLVRDPARKNARYVTDGLRKIAGV
jgi:hypothetical protein